MSQEQKAQDEIRRGVLAQQVIDNPIFQEAILRVKGRLMAEFEGTKFFQRKKRDEIWRTFQNLKSIEAEIKKVMTSGKVGERTLSIIKGNKKAES